MKPIRLGMVGAGGMARWHIKNILKQQDTTRIAALCEPSDTAFAETAKLFKEAGLKTPPREKEFEAFVAKHAPKLDAAFIITPHNQHFAQTMALLGAGVDALLEKPMVLNVSQAAKLIRQRDKTGRLLAVAFNGSLSPAIRKAAEMIKSGELGKLQSISATVWQDWDRNTLATWRQIPKIAGGGFLFDTGAHMLNTTADLAGEPFAEVAAFLDNCGRKVDILGVAIGRLQSGALVSLHGSGNTVAIDSEVKVFLEDGVIHTGVWGERLLVQKRGDPAPVAVPLPPSLGAWETFVSVRQGRIPNPSPPEIGLRMTQLWDAMRESAGLGGQPVKVTR